MKLSSTLSVPKLRPIFLLLLFMAVPFVASAQEKMPAPPPKSTPAPKSAPAAKPAPSKDSKSDGEGGGEEKTAGKPTTAGPVKTNSGGTPNNKPNPNNANKPAAGKNATGRATGAAKAETSHATSALPADPRAPSGLNLRKPDSGGAATAKTNSSPAGAGSHPLGPGTTRLANGGTRTTGANGSTIERNRNGKLTAITTSKGATAKFDAHGKAAAIHDGKGTTISRGPHGERRIETTHADHSRLVSYGKRGGYSETRFSRGGHEFARRTYYVNGQYYTRVYAPYFYMGYPYYGYVPGFYFVPAFYGWAYTPWSTDVSFTWGWYGSPWYTPFAYYFTPYGVYPAPAFWLADYAIAGSLQAGAEEQAGAGADDGAAAPADGQGGGAASNDAGAASGEASNSVQGQSDVMYASASVAPQAQGKAAPAMASTLKDQIAEQVKQIGADEKDAAAGANSTPPVPPSLDSRYTLFIVSSELSLETVEPACSLTAGDVIHRKDYTPDANNTVTVEVVSSKNGDCPVGTTSRLKVDDLEEMQDNFRQKVDDGLKSLSENQGKNGIPAGPAANPRQVPEGHADPDTTVGDELKKQQADADATEKEIQAASADTPNPTAD